MILFRHRRTFVWSLLLVGLPAALFLIPMDDRASGYFHLRPATHVEVRAPVAGFLKEVTCDESDRVSRASRVASIEVPDLEPRLAQKQAELTEAQAKLRLLKIGPRPEEVAEQRLRVARAKEWRQLARLDLKRTQQAFEEDTDRLEKQIVACRAELDVAQDSYRRA